MPDRKTLPRNPRKRSFRVGYIFAFPFIGIALGFILTNLTQTSRESHVQSPIGGNHGPEHSDVGAILESPDTKSHLSGASVSDEPSTRTSALFALARTKPGWILNQEHNNPETAYPWMSSPGEEEVNDVEASIADAGYRQIEELGLGGMLSHPYFMNLLRSHRRTFHQLCQSKSSQLMLLRSPQKIY